MRTTTKAALCAVAFGTCVPVLQAQSRPEWGVQGAVAFDGGSTFGLGGRVRYRFKPTMPSPIWAQADLNWFPQTGSSTFDLNWNLVYDFVPQSSFKFFAGGGPNVSLCTSCPTSIHFGANAVGGFDMGRLGQLQPYLEGRYTFFSLEAFIITFGVRF